MIAMIAEYIMLWTKVNGRHKYVYSKSYHVFLIYF